MADKIIEEVSPEIAAFLEEERIRKAALEEKKAADFLAPYDPEALLEVRHMRKTFPIEKSLMGKVQKAILFLKRSEAYILPLSIRGSTSSAGNFLVCIRYALTLRSLSGAGVGGVYVGFSCGVISRLSVIS